MLTNTTLSSYMKGSKDTSILKPCPVGPDTFCHIMVLLYVFSEFTMCRSPPPQKKKKTTHTHTQGNENFQVAVYGNGHHA